MTSATVQENIVEDTANSQPTETMKAAVIRQFGDVDVLQYEEIDTPKPKPGHILIKVLAAGINRTVGRLTRYNFPFFPSPLCGEG